MLELADAGNSLPSSLRAVPLHCAAEGNPLNLCVIARTRPDPAAGAFVVLRDLADATVYLGCIADASGAVWDWIELWVQDPDKLHTSLDNLREHLTNQALDSRWTRLGEVFREADPANTLTTGGEAKHPAPAFLDVALTGPLNPFDGNTARSWRLCTDDARLRAAGLPAYSNSLFRYLHDPADARSKFIPVSKAGPENENTAAPSAAWTNHDHLLPFNPHAGLTLARAFAPITFEDYADILGGKPWRAEDGADAPFSPGEAYRTLEDPGLVQKSGSHLFLGTQGRAGRLLETFHLKIHLITEVLRQVRAFVQRQQLPFLNLAGDSFRVRLNASTTGLPFLWTAQLLLARPSQAFALPVENSDFRYFIPARSSASSIYLPEGAGQPIQSVGTVRLRRVLNEQGRTVIEGTLVFHDRLRVSENDLLWVHLLVQNERVDLYGHLYASEGLAHGEARFRTLGQKLPEKTAAALRASEGVSFARTVFDVVPLTSSPTDLYSLGVLAARTLFVNKDTTLAVALDELLSLSRQVGVAHDPQHELRWRVHDLFHKDKRWLKDLGPQNLLWDPIDPAEAAAVLPMEMWSETLGAVARLFPGMGPDSVCKDFGDAPSLALENVFDAPLADFERILRRSRSLVVIDWNYNREIHDVISGFLTGT
jgi:hypothetical protein